jgi:hypothetical protein
VPIDVQAPLARDLQDVLDALRRASARPRKESDP